MDTIHPSNGEYSKGTKKYNKNNIFIKNISNFCMQKAKTSKRTFQKEKQEDIACLFTYFLLEVALQIIQETCRGKKEDNQIFISKMNQIKIIVLNKKNVCKSKNRPHRWPLGCMKIHGNRGMWI